MGAQGSVEFIAAVVALKVDIVAPVAHPNGGAIGGFADELKGRVVARVKA